MAVIIKVGEKANAKKVRLEIDARKSLSGDVMVFDHGDIEHCYGVTQLRVSSLQQGNIAFNAGNARRNQWLFQP